MSGPADLPRDDALLTVAQSRAADAFAIDQGVSGLALMEAAGAAIAEAIQARWSPRRATILCGPGNNGGDGFVVARLLGQAGWGVRLAMLGAVERLPDDARHNAELWQGGVEPLSADVVDDAELVVDALFGAGLARPLEGVALEIIGRLDDHQGRSCVGVDIPSGVHGDTGEILGGAPECDLTVTFFRRKPGHLLLPGRLRCGETVVADIGIPDSAIAEIGPQVFANSPALWREQLPRPRLDDNKYDRGHAVIRGGEEMTGAARLASRGALRAGAGLVTITCPAAAFPIYAADLTSVMVKPLAGRDDFAAFLDDARKTAVLVGPGNGVNLGTRAAVAAALATGKSCVLDADALSVYEDAPDDLFGAIRSAVVMTPHDGEYGRLFDHHGDRLSRARAAAAESGAIVVLKGADTVVATPDGRATIAGNAPASLATAGAGDVLSGIILGLLSQGMKPFQAASAGVWLHGEAANEVGLGLISDDLPDHLPTVLTRLARM